MDMDVPRFESDVDPVDVIKSLRQILSKVFHDTNNPLSIVSGNAQYVLELGKAMDLDEEVIQPVRDIEEASERVAEYLRDIQRVRDGLDRYLESVDARGTS